MREKDFLNWLEDPITREFLELIKEHREASFLAITQGVLNTTSLKDLDLTVVGEYRGQVFAFDKILDIKDFVDEKIERKLNNEDDTVGTKSDY